MVPVDTTTTATRTMVRGHRGGTHQYYESGMVPVQMRPYQYPNATTMKKRTTFTSSSYNLRFVPVVVVWAWLLLIDVVWLPNPIRNGGCWRNVLAMKHSFRIDRTSHNLIGPIGDPFGFNENGHYEIQVFNFELKVRYNKTMVKGYKKKKQWNEETKQKFKQQQQDVIDSVEAGFFLQKYDNLASFHQYMNTLRSDHTLCAFSHFIGDNDRILKGSNMLRQLQEGGTDDDPEGNDAADDAFDDMYATPGDDMSYPNPSNQYIDDDFHSDSVAKDANDISINDSPMPYSTAGDGIFYSVKSKNEMWKPNQPAIEYRFQAYVA
jgi:hypothetical protein